MATLTLQSVSKHYGPVPVLLDCTLSVVGPAIVAAQGHSGSGKTTLLRLVAGLETAETGTITAPARDVGIVFQHPVLMPHLNVRDNLAMGYRLHYNVWSKTWWEKTEPSDLRQRLDEAVQLLELDALQRRLPSELSGGQRQRAALGRCLVRRPAVFLLDEPLASLDPALAGRLRTSLRATFQRWQSTVLWVTHDPAEARTVADRILTITNGRIIGDTLNTLPDTEERVPS
jgi:multiple sugar transport system ATP-binding protein